MAWTLLTHALLGAVGAVLGMACLVAWIRVEVP
jgi:hypothetical protein